MASKRRDDATDQGRDRRSSTRYRTRALTDGSLVDDTPKGGRSFLGTTVNVSSGGVLVRTYEALNAGQEVALKVHLPEGDLKVAGTVLHVEQDAVGCRLAGVRFSALGDDESDLLERHLRTYNSRLGAAAITNGASGGGGSGRPLKSLSEKVAKDFADETAALISSATQTTTKAPNAKGAGKGTDAAKDPAPAAEPGPVKSIGDLRRRETVVFPFEGQIHRG